MRPAIEVLCERVTEAVRIGAPSSLDDGPFVVVIDGGEHLLAEVEAQAQLCSGLQAALLKSQPGWTTRLVGVQAADAPYLSTFLRSLVKDLPPSSEKRQLCYSLENLDWSTDLATAISSRLRKSVTRDRTIVVVPPAVDLTEGRQRELVDAVFALAAATKAPVVVFCECTSSLRSVQYCRVPAPVIDLSAYVDIVRSRMQRTLGASASKAASAGLLKRLIGWFSGDSKMPPPPDISPWVDFIVQCAYPNLRVVDQIVMQFLLVDRQLTQWEQEVAPRFANPTAVHLANGPAPSASTAPASEPSRESFLSEKDELRKRAFFMAVLYITHPEEINRARATLGGGYTLYGAQVHALSGFQVRGIAGDASHNRTRDNLGSYFQRAMSSIGALSTNRIEPVESMVTRFPSASALRRHIEWQFGAASLQEARLGDWEQWIDRTLHGRIAWLAGLETQTPLALPSALLSDGVCHPEALLERASWILEVVELGRPAVIKDDRGWVDSGPETSSRQFLNTVGGYLDRVLAISDRALRFEALLVKSRHLVLCGGREHAEMCVSEARRLLDGSSPENDPRVLMADLAAAYVQEVSGQLEAAPKSYVVVAQAAERANVDEVLWRAVFGAMRCGLTSVQSGEKTDPPSSALMALRAQVLLRVQQSRSPRLINLLSKSKPELFISYRSESREIALAIRDGFKGTDADAWLDQRLDHDTQDFAAEIQKRLWECDAVLFLVSAKYWESLYCCCEMWSVSSRHGLGGGQVNVFWMVIDDEPPADDTQRDAKAKFEQFMSDASKRVSKVGPKHAMEHFMADVSKNRILGRGSAVLGYPLLARRSTPDDGPLIWIDSDQRKEEILQTLVNRVLAIRKDRRMADSAEAAIGAAVGT